MEVPEPSGTFLQCICVAQGICLIVIIKWDVGSVLGSETECFDLGCCSFLIVVQSINGINVLINFRIGIYSLVCTACIDALGGPERL